MMLMDNLKDMGKYLKYYILEDMISKQFILKAKYNTVCKQFVNKCLKGMLEKVSLTEISIIPIMFPFISQIIISKYSFPIMKCY